MPRQARNYIKQGYYHIFIKATINCPLFRTQKDYDKYLELLQMKTRQFNINLIAYVLLNDNIQLLIEESTPGTLSSLIHGISVLYTKYYHRKYDTKGSLFSGRFKSEPIHHHQDLLCRTRYIHQRPTLGKHLTLHYTYSSYTHYLKPTQETFIRRHIIYDLLNKKDYNKACNLFKTIHYMKEDSSYFNHKEDLYSRVETAKLILKEELATYQVDYSSLQKSSNQRDNIVLRLYQKSELSQQEIADLLSLSRHVIGRIIRYYQPR